MGLNMGFISNNNGRVWTTRIWQFHIIPPYETLLVWRGAGFLVRKILPSWDSKRNMSCFQTEQCGNGHCKIDKMKNSVLHVLDIASTTIFAFLEHLFGQPPRITTQPIVALVKCCDSKPPTDHDRFGNKGCSRHLNAGTWSCTMYWWITGRWPLLAGLK